MPIYSTHYPDLCLQMLKDFIYNNPGLGIGDQGLGSGKNTEYRIQNSEYSVF